MDRNLLEEERGPLARPAALPTHETVVLSGSSGFGKPRSPRRPKEEWRTRARRFLGRLTRAIAIN